MGALVITKYKDFIEQFMMNNPISDWVICIVSYDIAASIEMTDISRDRPTMFTNAINYVSKYENVEFISSLRPSYNTLEIGYGNKDAFEESYYSHLIDKDPFTDACCIADIILNEDSNVIIVFSETEYITGVGYVLSDFFEEEFKIHAYLLEDILRLCNTYGTDDYKLAQEQFQYTIPETFDGTNPSAIWEQVTDDLDDAKSTLQAQKIIAQDINSKPGMEDSIESIFFNKFTETLEDKLEYILNSKELPVIRELCRQKGIPVSKNNSKEFLVTKLLREIKKSSSRIIEYKFQDDDE